MYAIFTGLTFMLRMVSPNHFPDDEVMIGQHIQVKYKSRSGRAYVQLFVFMSMGVKEKAKQVYLVRFSRWGICRLFSILVQDPDLTFPLQIGIPL